MSFPRTSRVPDSWQCQAVRGGGGRSSDMTAFPPANWNPSESPVDGRFETGFPDRFDTPIGSSDEFSTVPRASNVLKSHEARRVLIIGGSTRAAAWSALRARFQPICADLFADADTRKIARVIPVGNYPGSLAEDIALVEADGWFYTGGIENHADLVSRIDARNARHGPLWGSPAESLRLIRNPFWVHETLQGAGLPSLDVRPQSAPPAADGNWMRKPLQSAGGLGVRIWKAEAQLQQSAIPHYFQRRQRGLVQSALYRATDGVVEFLALTRQIADFPESCAPEPFSYLGSIGPVTEGQNDLKLIDRLTTAATLLAGRSGLAGLFGVDFICDDHGVPSILEVNPRYTASVEVVELAQNRSLLFPGLQTRPRAPGAATRGHVVGKLVLYADRQIVAPEFQIAARESSSPATDCDPWRIPEIADIPIPGSIILPGWPICTVLASADCETACLARLRERARAVRKEIDRGNPTRERTPGNSQGLAK